MPTWLLDNVRPSVERHQQVKGEDSMVEKIDLSQ